MLGLYKSVYAAVSVRPYMYTKILNKPTAVTTLIFLFKIIIGKVKKKYIV